ncbi:ATP-binding cassette domain-containing protein [Herbidospora yilanensis]|uniref:ATP-binding cassette domain-containing protein n=1 Tax=Herbidospora yilanensis TaxID=354426 RepID=UPI00078496E6|nr:ABC transporter ATP-binding protein [Herbidospora yilanensis]
MTPLLAVHGLTVRYGRDRPAVAGADLTVEAGQIVAVVGESGSGKSTLAHALAGLLPDTATTTGGVITFGGERIDGLRERGWRRLRGRRIAFVPQDPGTALNPLMTVRAQLAEALRLAGTPRPGRDALEDALARVGIPDPAEVLGRYPHQLSGGFRQRVLLGMALAGRPELLIADEPTSALDTTVQKTVLDLIQQVAVRDGTSILLITHDLGVAADRADRVAVMTEGRVVEEGPAGRVLGRPEAAYTRLLLDSAPRPLTGPAPPEGEPLLAVRDLRKVFPDGKVAVDGVSFSLTRAGAFGLVGASGSGKSTVARMITALIEPTAGSVLLDGAPVRAGRVQFVTQNPYTSLDPLWSVGRIIAEPLRATGGADRRAQVRRLLEEVALPPEVARRRPSALSGGQRQRVAIARALAPSPDLIVLDEPVSALDAVTQAQILALLRRLRDSRGMSSLLISHDLAVVAAVAERLAVMRDGRIVESGPTADVLASPEASFTRDLLAAIPGRGR